MSEPKLSIELIPSTSFYINLRSFLSAGKWRKLRAIQLEKAKYKCEICDKIPKGKGPRQLECHETWEFDEINFIQKLTGLIILCPTCHSVKHFGFTLNQTKGNPVAAIRKLMIINKWDDDQTAKYIEEKFKQWAERSTHPWKMDYTWLEKIPVIEKVI